MEGKYSWVNIINLVRSRCPQTSCMKQFAATGLNYRKRDIFRPWLCMFIGCGLVDGWCADIMCRANRRGIKGKALPHSTWHYFLLPSWCTIFLLYSFTYCYIRLHINLYMFRASSLSSSGRLKNFVKPLYPRSVWYRNSVGVEATSVLFTS
jgi:hypothetical protein